MDQILHFGKSESEQRRDFQQADRVRTQWRVSHSGGCYTLGMRATQRGEKEHTILGIKHGVFNHTTLGLEWISSRCLLSRLFFLASLPSSPALVVFFWTTFLIWFFIFLWVLPLQNQGGNWRKEEFTFLLAFFVSVSLWETEPLAPFLLNTAFKLATEKAKGDEEGIHRSFHGPLWYGIPQHGCLEWNY